MAVEIMHERGPGPEPEPKPKGPIGSGVFAIGGGVLFVGAFLALLFLGLDGINLFWCLQVWLLVSAGILIWWGVQRLKSGKPSKWAVGQDTMGFVITAVGVALALAALVKDSGGKPASTSSDKATVSR